MPYGKRSNTNLIPHIHTKMCEKSWTSCPDTATYAPRNDATEHRVHCDDLAYLASSYCCVSSITMLLYIYKCEDAIYLQVWGEHAFLVDLPQSIFCNRTVTHLQQWFMASQEDFSFQSSVFRSRRNILCRLSTVFINKTIITLESHHSTIDKRVGDSIRQLKS